MTQSLYISAGANADCGCNGAATDTRCANPGTDPHGGLGEYALPLYAVQYLHCNENPIYVFPEKELRGLSPSFHIHVSGGDLYIHRIGPHIFLQQKRQTDPGNI